MNTNNVVFLRGLDHVMRMNGLTCTDIALSMGKSIAYRQNVSNWRHCRNKATIESMKQVAEAIGCEPMQLIAVPNMAELITELSYTVHSYLQEVVALRLAIAQLDAK